MRDLLHNTNFMTLLGTLFGGVGVKFLEQWLGRAKAKSDDASEIRDELRKQIDDMRSQLVAADAEERRLEALVDSWKEKYFDLRDEKQKIVTDLSITLDRLKTLESKIQARVDNQHQA